MRILNTIKIFTSIVILLAIIFSISFYADYKLKKDSGYFEQRIVAVEASAMKDDWQKASSDIKSIKDEWSGTKNIWAVLIDHNEIDNIDQALEKVMANIQLLDKKQSLTESSTLKLFIRHIPEKESLSLKNIL